MMLDDRVTDRRLQKIKLRNKLTWSFSHDFRLV